MKIFHFSTYEKTGGAARSAYRLHHALRLKGHDSRFIVGSKISDDWTVWGPQTRHARTSLILSRYIEYLSVIAYRNRPNIYFTAARFSPQPFKWIKDSDSDIIHLQWIGDGFFRIESLAEINKPIVWTLHDSWAFTGGCHVPFDCKRYQDSCGKCPALASSKIADLSMKIMQRKKKAWKNLNLTLVTPSRWLAECVQSSSLFRNREVHVIPNGIDTNRFKPTNRTEARKFLNLPANKILIMIGAIAIDTDKNKGLHLLREAIKRFIEKYSAESLELVIFGMSAPKNDADIGVKTHYIGRLEDEISLSLLYNSVDVVVVPSLQESFGLTALEALSSGTPVVAFDTTGLKDIIRHKMIGYLAKAFDAEDLANGIFWVTEDQDRWETLSINARKHVQQYLSIDMVTDMYIDLYKMKA